MKTTRLENLGREAAAASMDAHGELVSADIAYSFLQQVYLDTEDDAEADELLGQPYPPIEFVAGYYLAAAQA